MTQPLQTCTWSSRIASQIPNTSVPIPPTMTTLLDTPAAGTIAIVGPGVSTFRDLTMRYEKRTIELASANALSRWRASSTC